MVELMVGLVALLALFAGLLQVATLTRAHTDTMINARREAAEMATLDLSSDMDILSSPDYVGDWLPGPDGRHHSRDDTTTSGNAAGLHSEILSHATATMDEWEFIDDVPANRISRLHSAPGAIAFFGLVRGYDSQEVVLDSAVRQLLYQADVIDVECEVWMTWTKGIY